jgi:hypothetical protein
MGDINVAHKTIRTTSGSTGIRGNRNAGGFVDAMRYRRDGDVMRYSVTIDGCPLDCAVINADSLADAERTAMHVFGASATVRAIPGAGGSPRLPVSHESRQCSAAIQRTDAGAD